MAPWSTRRNWLPGVQGENGSLEYNEKMAPLDYKDKMAPWSTRIKWLPGVQR